MGKLVRSRTVVHVHAADYDELYGGGNKLFQMYTRKVMGIADVVVAVSEDWRDQLSQFIPKHKIVALRNCIALEDINTKEDSKHAIANALFIGSVGPRKGAFDLIEAVNLLKDEDLDLQVSVAGYEERDGDLQIAASRIEELGLASQYKLVGTVQGPEKDKLLNNADFFVLPSYAEGLPMAIIEAMASGLAIISTHVGGIPEVVKDGYNGFLISPGNIAELAEKIAVLTCDPKLSKIMGDRSRQFVEDELDVFNYTRKLVMLYDSIMERF